LVEPTTCAETITGNTPIAVIIIAVHINTVRVFKECKNSFFILEFEV